MSIFEGKSMKRAIAIAVSFIMIMACFGMADASYAASKTPAKVKNLKATATTTTSISLKWNKVAKVKVNGKKKTVKYQVSYKTGSTTKKVTTTSKSKKLTGLKAGTKYSIKVRGYYLNSKKKKVYGKWSAAKTIYTKAKAVKRVTGLEAKGGDQMISASWDKVAKVKAKGSLRTMKYQLGYKSEDEDSWSYVTTEELSASTDSGLDKGTKYQVKVRAYYLLNSKRVYGKWTDVKSVYTKDDEPAQVKNLKVTPGTAKISASWDKVAKVNARGTLRMIKYEMGYKESGDSKWTYVDAEGNLNAATEEAPIPGGLYQIKVRAYYVIGDDITYGEWSDVEEVVIDPVDVSKVEGLSLTGKDGVISASWNSVKSVKVKGEDMTMQYQLGYKEASESTWSYVKTGSCAADSSSDLLPGSEYSAKVRAYYVNDGKTVYGDWSAIATCYTKPLDVETVTGLSTSNSGGDISASWSAVSAVKVNGTAKAMKYEFEYTDEDTGVIQTVTVSTNSASFTPEADASYSVKVRAFYENGTKKVYGGWSATKTIGI